jgi:hypothetical protein
MPEMKNNGIVVLMSNGDAGEKWMSMGVANQGRKLVDISGSNQPDVALNENGEGLFTVGKETIAIYVDEAVSDQYK